MESGYFEIYFYFCIIVLFLWINNLKYDSLRNQ